MGFFFKTFLLRIPNFVLNFNLALLKLKSGTAGKNKQRKLISIDLFLAGNSDQFSNFSEYI